MGQQVFSKLRPALTCQFLRPLIGSHAGRGPKRHNRSLQGTLRLPHAIGQIAQPRGQPAFVSVESQPVFGDAQGRRQFLLLVQHLGQH